MKEIIKAWNDGSGDTYTTIYNHEEQVIRFSSMPNYGAGRDSVVKFHSEDGKESFGVLLRQGAVDTHWESKAGLLGRDAKDSVGFGHLEGVDLRCVVFLNKEGDPCVIKFVKGL